MTARVAQEMSRPSPALAPRLLRCIRFLSHLLQPQTVRTRSGLPSSHTPQSTFVRDTPRRRETER